LVSVTLASATKLENTRQHHRNASTERTSTAVSVPPATTLANVTRNSSNRLGSHFGFQLDFQNRHQRPTFMNIGTLRRSETFPEFIARIRI
jgi:hypothetical protein